MISGLVNGEHIHARRNLVSAYLSSVGRARPTQGKRIKKLFRLMRIACS